MPTTTIHMSADERAALDAAADASSLGPSSYARRAVMAACGRDTRVRRKPDGLARALGSVLGDLGHVGNNINQLTRHAHQGGRVPPEALRDVRVALDRLTAAVMSLRDRDREPPG